MQSDWRVKAILDRKPTPVLIFLEEGCRVNGQIMLPDGSRIVDTFNAKNDLEHFMEVRASEVTTPTGNPLKTKTLFVNRNFVLGIYPSR